MMPIPSNKLQVKHLLKADPFGQNISVYNNDSGRQIDLVEDTDDFFSHIYINTSGNLIINDIEIQQTLEDWLIANNNFSEKLDCLLFLSKVMLDAEKVL